MSAPIIVGTERPRPAAAARDRLQVVVNANASASLGAHALDRLLRELRAGGCAPECHRTRSVAELAEVHASSRGRLVLVGGDGSLHAAAQLPGPPREIALIPAGRANNIARSLGIPVELEAAAWLAALGRARPLDVIATASADRRHIVVEGASVGFLARARTRYRGRNSAGRAAALRAGAAALAAYAPMEVHVVAPGRDEHLRLAQLFVANLPLYAFGLHVAPGAVADDGLLDVVGVEATTRRALLRTVRELHEASRFRHPGVHRWRVPSLRVDTHGCSPVVGDSVTLGPGPVELRCRPGALRVVRP